MVQDIFKSYFGKLMNRRHFILAAVALSFHSSIARAAPTGPYGATHLEDTDLSSLEDSLRSQLALAHIPIPNSFDLFPKVFTSEPSGGANEAKGDDPGLSSLLTIRAGLNTFKGEPACGKFAVEEAPKSWRIFVALHELSHLVAFQKKEDGTSLFDRTVCTINKIPYQDAASYVVEMFVKIPDRVINTVSSEDALLFVISQNKKYDALTVGLGTLSQIKESIADVSAVLYLLSNYEDVRNNHQFLNNLVDLRTSFITDYDHMTVDAIQYAIDMFSKHPITGLSLVETTNMATSIVRNLPRYNGTIKQIADTIRQDMVRHRHFRSLQSGTDKVWRDNVLAARNRACSLIPIPH